MAYNRLPMGLMDSASVFQRAISSASSQCDNCIAFTDGETKDEQDKALVKVQRTLHDHDFWLNPPKCLYSRIELPFLSNIISATGIMTDSKNIEPIVETPIYPPRTLKKVQSFLGALNFYSSYIPNLASIAEPLRQLTRKN